MTRLSDRQAYVVAAASGAILWVATTVVSGKREAWDSSLYWTLAYPVGILVAGGVGFLASRRPWRWGLTLMLAQAVTLAFVASSFGLLPLGLLMFGVLALPPMAAAALAARLRSRYLPT